MIKKETISIFNNLFSKLKLGNIKYIELLKSSQNNVYKIATTENVYVLKHYSKAAIKNSYQLKKKIKQISVSYTLNKNGIKSILPLTLNGKPVFTYNKNYYSIYKYVPETSLTEETITLKHVKILAQTQSKIHKLGISIDLPCRYTKIHIDFDSKLQEVKLINTSLYNYIVKKVNVMNIIISQCNNNITKFKNNLCISHNDYKLLNILWKDKKLTLLDFDAVGYANPTCCLCESAFTFSKYNKQIRYEFYEEYIKSYLSDYGNIKETFKDALYASLNGKLQWLQHMLSTDNIKKYIKEIPEMIDELILYHNNINKFNKIYLNIIHKS